MDTSEDTLSEELSLLFREDVTVSDVTSQRMDGTEVAVANMSYWKINENQRHYKQTVLVLRDSHLQVPDFILQSRSTGLLPTSFPQLIGPKPIEFPDSPRFESQFVLSGPTEIAIRALFTKSVRDFFERDPDWTIRGTGNCLVLCHPNKIQKEHEREHFTEQGIQILTLLQEAEERLDQQPELRRQATLEELNQSTIQLGGIAGMVLSEQLKRLAIKRSDLENYLQSTPPRQPPRALIRQLYSDQFKFLFVGLGFLILGIVMGSVLLLTMAENSKLVAITVTATVPTIGLALLLASLRFHLRTSRTLRSGRVASGTIQDIKSTSSDVNGQHKFHIFVQYELDGTVQDAKFNAYGFEVDFAKNLLSRGEPTRFLIDPTDPSHVICVDTLRVSDGS
ncbi:MAG: DUF3592 domain-containing protein [Rubripirellula sp.]